MKLNKLSLNTVGLNRIGLNRIGLPSYSSSSGSGRPYIDPELLSHVKMAISTWGKSNDDPDRAVLKDLSGNGNDMRLLNFGFAEGSGYGKYKEDFTTWIPQYNIADSTRTSNKLHITKVKLPNAILYTRKAVKSMKVEVKGSRNIELYYRYSSEKNVSKLLMLDREGIYELPDSLDYNYTGFEIHNYVGDCDITITQIPDFEGWLCTDGVDDIIESINPVSEMLEGSKEITVVSIIHQTALRGSTSEAYNNYIRPTGAYIRNGISDYGKTGIYGYTCSNVKNASASNTSIINNLLGDKNDYSAESVGDITKSKFYVQGYIDSNGAIKEVSKIAYAGGFIANKVLTTDEINQIIAYFNLDRPGQIIKPQLYCNIKKQGITNDNHAEFNDQLIDFVGGHNIQLNNIGWEGESGINSYPVVFGNNKTWESIRPIDETNWKYTFAANKITIYKVLNGTSALFYSLVARNNVAYNISVPSFKIKINGLKIGEHLRYHYVSNDNPSSISIIYISSNGIYVLPSSAYIQLTEETPGSLYIGLTATLNNRESIEGVTIEILPTIENALCLDGISDFGKATGLPILKDYTVVADREAFLLKGGIVSKSNAGSNGAFIFNNSDTVNDYTYSFGSVNTLDDKDYSRKILYQSKYIYNGSPIKVSTGVDSDSMWLGTIRDGDSRFSKLALWSLMLFPYSLSEFLLERQLRKYKAGTLYPDMIEFRPIVKSNIPYSSISYSVNPGEYVTEGSMITITITLSNASDKLIGVSSNAISDISISGDNGTYEITGKVAKSPQKISIVISSYLTMLGNDTLISNETLIKNE